MWYPTNSNELNKMLETFLNQKPILKNPPKKVNGIIVPHAGYEYSGSVAGKAYSLLKYEKFQKAVIIGPSHYVYTSEPLAHNKNEWQTPSGSVKVSPSNFQNTNLIKEHSIDNQIPFLQKLGIKEILPLMIGDISTEQAKNIAEKISKISALFVFSTDLSHFLPYDDAKKIDAETIEIIESLDTKKFNCIDACGIEPLKILFHICQILKTKPHLIEYKNSGDVTGEKSQVVGYASFYF